MAIEIQTNLALEAWPVEPEHVVNIKWILDYFTGKVKAPVRLVDTENFPSTYNTGTKELTASAMARHEIDGEEVDADDRVLLVGQTDRRHNGIYTVIDEGHASQHAKLRRADDFDESHKIFSGVTIAVLEGDAHENTTWKLLTPDPIVLDTSLLDFIPTIPTTAAHKFAKEIEGDDNERDFDIEHNLGTEDVNVTIWNSQTKGLVLCDVVIEDSDKVVVKFANPVPDGRKYNVVVFG